MAFVHGKNTFVSYAGNDLSSFTKSTDFNDGVETHDVTTYGPTRTRKSYQAGLGDGKITLKGVHDNGPTCPRRVLKPLMQAGTLGTFLFRPEGTGSGRTQSSVQALVSAYNESDPVDDMVQWTAELQMSGDISDADQ